MKQQRNYPTESNLKEAGRQSAGSWAYYKIKCFYNNNGIELRGKDQGKKPGRKSVGIERKTF